jgi:hypothetical protein
MAVCSAFGFGGVDMSASFANTKGLDARLTALDREWDSTSTGAFRTTSPLWWLGGHGGGHVGLLTVGGRGAVMTRNAKVDGLAAEMFGVNGFFDIGFPYAPVEQFWVRPCLELGGGTWVHYIHSDESFSQPDFSRWYLAWTFGMLPGAEVMGRIRYMGDNYVGLFVKGGYFVPFSGPGWSGDAEPPKLGLSGFALQFGLRFGKLEQKSFRL